MSDNVPFSAIVGALDLANADGRTWRCPECERNHLMEGQVARLHLVWYLWHLASLERTRAAIVKRIRTPETEDEFLRRVGRR